MSISVNAPSQLPSNNSGSERGQPSQLVNLFYISEVVCNRRAQGNSDVRCFLECGNNYLSDSTIDSENRYVLISIYAHLC